MSENDIAHVVLGSALAVHRHLGPGLLESVYEEVLAYEIELRGLRCARQVSVPITYQTVQFAVGFRADIIVEGSVILELKSVETILPVHKKQLLTCLRLTDLRLGLLINFNVPLRRDGFSRIVNGL